MLHRCCSFLTSLSLLLLVGLVPLSVSAQVPHDMAYQGVLTDAVGAPLTGPVTLVFRVFDLPSGGTPLYTETHSDVAIDPIDGSFLVQLGLGTTDLDTDGDGAAETNLHAFDASLFENGPNRYLEIQVGSGVSGEILDPRQMIGSVPYALVAEDVVTDPATSTVGALIAAAQTAATDAQLTADNAQATADAVVNTQLSEAEVDAFVANNGYVTVDTNTQLSEAEVDAFVANNGYVTVDTNTQLSETEVVAIVANNGFASNQDVATQAAQLASLVSLVDPSVNDRFQACSDGLTVADRATGLLWERKTGTVGSGRGVICNAQGACVDPHDINNLYSHGRAFSFFLASLNGGEGFGGHTDWRLPVVSEWQSILVGPGVNASVNAEPADPQAGSNATGQPAICNVSPCVDPGFSTRAGPTSNLSTTNRAGAWYWSAASRADNSFLKYLISFDFPHFVDSVFVPDVQQNNFVRAVRNGSCSPSAPLAEQVAATDVVVSGLETAVVSTQASVETAQGAADAAQATATAAQATAAAAQATADAVVDTQLSEAEVDAFVANNGYVTVDTNTQLSETEVVAIVANNGFASNQDVATQAAQLASLVSLVDPSVNDRFQACSDGLTVADRETGLLWERKTGSVGSGAGGNCDAPGSCVDPHDVNNRYSWSSSGSAADGPAFTSFLASLNGGAGFAGHADWRLPVVSEWQSILVGPGVNTSVNAEPDDPAAGSNPTGQPTTCSVSPCVDPEFAALVGPTASLSGSGNWYWSASSSASNPARVYTAVFSTAAIFTESKLRNPPLHVRAVRNGSCSASAPLAEQVAATDVVVSALETAVGANQSAITALSSASTCATAADVVCNPALSCPAAPACDTLGSYNLGFADGGNSVDITSDNAAVCTTAGGTYDAVSDSCSVDITTDNAAAEAAAGSAACTQAGGTWGAGTSTCTPAYNCFIGGFCSQAAIVYPPGLNGYTNVYDGHTRSTEPALGAGCSGTDLVRWQDGRFHPIHPGSPDFNLLVAGICE